MRKELIPAAIAAVLAMSLPAAGSSAPQRAVPAAKGRTQIIHPLSLTRIADMDFALLGVTTGGTATIDPISGAMTTSGGLVQLGGNVSPARYTGAASKRTVVNIRIPKKPVLITRVGGTETLSLSAFTLDGQDKRTLAAASSFTFAVGATITVPAGTVEGTYEGNIDVTVQYP